MCKMAHFGNCDPETADQEYCIFHKPDKSEEEAREFYNKFVLKFFGYKLPKNNGYSYSTDIDASGYVFPNVPEGVNDDVGGTIDFSESIFNGQVNFYKARFQDNVRFFVSNFNKDVNFQKCSFEGLVDFSESTFDKRAIFNDAEFQGACDFSGATFKAYTGFCGITFYSEVQFTSARFEGILDFSKSVKTNRKTKLFGNEVMFSNSEIGVLYFTDVYSESYVSFDSSVLGDIKIEYSVLIGDISFHKSTIERLSLGRSEFHGEFSLRDVQVKQLEIVSSKFYDVVDMESCTFQGPVKMIGSNEFHAYTTFKKANFNESAEFSGIFNDYVEFSWAVFGSVLSFENATFEDKISFLNAKITHGIELTNNDMYMSSFLVLKNELDNKFHSNHGQAEIARILRLTQEVQHNREFADNIFIYEMRAKRKLRLEQANGNGWKAKVTAKTVNFFEWLLGDLPSEYGTNLTRIAETVLAVVVLFGILYWLTLISNILGITSVFGIISLLISIWHYQTFDNYPDKLAETLRFPAGVIIILGMLYWVVAPEAKDVVAYPDILLSNGTSVTYTGTVGGYIGTLLNALYYSLVTFTTLGYGDMHPIGWLKALSAIEALTGAVFMALIVAVIARKWMR